MLFNAIFCYNYLILFTFWCFFMVIAVVKKSSAPVPVPVQRKGRRGSLDAIAGAGRAAVAAVGSTARRKREKLRKTVAHYYPQGFKIPKLHPDVVLHIASFLEAPIAMFRVSKSWRATKQTYYNRLLCQYRKSPILNRFVSPSANDQIPGSAELAVAEMHYRIRDRDAESSLAPVPVRVFYPRLLERVVKRQNKHLDPVLISVFQKMSRQYRIDIRLTGNQEEQAEQIRAWFEEHSEGLSQIKALDLSGLGLGKIPEEIRYFSGITYLNLVGNAIEDVAPLGTLSELVSLDLRENNIEEWPSQRRFFKNLQILQLEGNDSFSPDQIGFLPPAVRASVREQLS